MDCFIINLLKFLLHKTNFTTWKTKFSKLREAGPCHVLVATLFHLLCFLLDYLVLAKFAKASKRSRGLKAVILIHKLFLGRWQHQNRIKERHITQHHITRDNITSDNITYFRWMTTLWLNFDDLTMALRLTNVRSTYVSVYELLSQRNVPLRVRRLQRSILSSSFAKGGAFEC